MGLIDTPAGLVVVRLRYFDNGRILSGKSIHYFSTEVENQFLFSWEKIPLPIWNALEISDANALVWERRANGLPTGKAPFCVPYGGQSLARTSEGSYIWDELNMSMVLIIAPYWYSFTDADPVPSGVWEANGHMCAFWKAPENARPIYFKMEGPVVSLEATVQHWRDRISGLQRRPWAHRGILAALLCVFTITLFVVLAIVFGQANTAAWIGAIGTVAGLVVTWFLSRPQAHKSHI